MKALNLSETTEYVCKDERGENGKPVKGATVFTIGVLDVFQHSHIRDAMMKMNPQIQTGEFNTQFNFNQGQIETVRFALKNVSNFLDEKGKEVKPKFENIKVGNYEYKVLNYDFIRRIPMEVIDELYQFVMQENELDADEEKNLNSQSA